MGKNALLNRNYKVLVVNLPQARPSAAAHAVQCVYNTLILVPTIYEESARTKCSMAVHQTLSCESGVWPCETNAAGG